jgi:hypothetical protein
MPQKQLPFEERPVGFLFSGMSTPLSKPGMVFALWFKFKVGTGFHSPLFLVYLFRINAYSCVFVAYNDIEVEIMVKKTFN